MTSRYTKTPSGDDGRYVIDSKAGRSIGEAQWEKYPRDESGNSGESKEAYDERSIHHDSGVHRRDHPPLAASATGFPKCRPPSVYLGHSTLTGRPHSSLGPGIPNLLGKPILKPKVQRHELPAACRVRIKDVLGGLHHEYWLEEIAA